MRRYTKSDNKVMRLFIFFMFGHTVTLFTIIIIDLYLSPTPYANGAPQRFFIL